MSRILTHSIVFAVLLAFGSAVFAQTEWEVVWEDEFQGSEIDRTHWEHMIGDGSAYGIPGWGNNELQYYTDRPENSYVSQGSLFIVARDESYQGNEYTSARLRSKYLAEFKYGRIEARIKVPRGQGIWPAFWMLPTESPYGGWAAGGEIDVVETINIPYDAHGTIHFGGEWPRNQMNGGSVSLGVDLSEDFHVYALEWEPDSFIWFIDGNEYYTVRSDQWYSENGGNNERAPFDHYFHMLLNVAVGGNWPGPPDQTTQFPQYLTVDWVRVSKREQTPNTLSDFSNFGLAGTYEDWNSGTFTSGPEEFRVQATNFGGGWYLMDAPVDASAASLREIFGTANSANEAEAFNVVLFSGAGTTQAGFNFEIIPGKQAYTGDLNNPDFFNAGDINSWDTTDLWDQWHLQGSFQNQNPLDLTFDNLALTSFSSDECLNLEVENLVAGERAIFTITKGTPGAKGITVYGLQAGTTHVENVAGYCATFGIKGIKQSRVLGGLNRTFDDIGQIQFSIPITGNVGGMRVFFQSSEKDTCPDECVSGLVEMSVQ